MEMKGKAIEDLEKQMEEERFRVNEEKATQRIRYEYGFKKKTRNEMKHLTPKKKKRK